MNKFIKLRAGILTVDKFSAMASRLAREEGSDHSFLCVLNKSPKPNDSLNDEVIIAASPAEGVECTPESDAAAARVLKRLALETSARIPPETLFADSDSDTSALDMIPSPEDEIRMIQLRFSIFDIKDLTFGKVREICENAGFSCTYERDGAVVRMNDLIALDLYFCDGANEIEGEFDATYAGAGVFAEVCELVDKLAEAFSAKVEFATDDRLTYPVDRDFEKLRALYVEMVRQQLAFAYADDRDGMQAFVAWGIDTYEPEEIPGTVVTCFGRCDLEKLRAEIAAFGLEAVADYRFLFRNHPHKTDDGEDLLKLALEVMWCRCNAKRENEFAIHDKFSDAGPSPAHLAYEYMRRLGECDISVPFMNQYFLELAMFTDQPYRINAIDRPQYVTHFPIGYLDGEIYFGFGSYLRHVKLPGDFFPIEETVGEHIVFVRRASGGRSGEASEDTLDVDIDYSGDEQLLEKRLGLIYGRKWEDFDIGGSSICKIESKSSLLNQNMEREYHVSVVILIKDELYTLDYRTHNQNSANAFIESIKNSRAVEDVGDPDQFQPGEKPRAIGGCFFKNGNHTPATEKLRRIEDKIMNYLTPTAVATIERGPATDINSKIGGVPYCPTGKKFLPAERGMIFLFQINFSEMNNDGALKFIPRAGIIQVWVKDPKNLHKFDECILQSGENLKVVFIPNVQGGYVTDPDGTILKTSLGCMLPAPSSQNLSTIMKIVEGEFPDGSVGAKDVIEAYRCPMTHIGGAPDYYRGMSMGLRMKLAELGDYQLISQIVFPLWSLRTILMIPKEDAFDENFTVEHAILVAYKTNPLDGEDLPNDRFMAVSDRFNELFTEEQEQIDAAKAILNLNPDENRGMRGLELNMDFFKNLENYVSNMDDEKLSEIMNLMENREENQREIDDFFRNEIYNKLGSPLTSIPEDPDERKENKIDCLADFVDSEGPEDDVQNDEDDSDNKGKGEQ